MGGSWREQPHFVLGARKTVDEGAPAREAGRPVRATRPNDA